MRLILGRPFGPAAGPCSGSLCARRAPGSPSKSQPLRRSPPEPIRPAKAVSSTRIVPRPYALVMLMVNSAKTSRPMKPTAMVNPLVSPPA